MNTAQIILLTASDEGQHEHAPIHTHRHIPCFYLFGFVVRVFFFFFSFFNYSLDSCHSFLLDLFSMVTLVLKLI